MNIEQHLRQLHKIEPDPAYARDSRARLMMATMRIPKVTFRVFVAGMFRSGFAMATIGLLLFFTVGGSVWSLVLNSVTGWDSKALLAEARAINTQIHLADLQYNDPGYERQRLIAPKVDFDSIATLTGPEDSDLPVSTPVDTAIVVADGADITTSTPATAPDGGATSTSTPAEPIDTTIDAEEALEILSH